MINKPTKIIHFLFLLSLFSNFALAEAASYDARFKAGKEYRLADKPEEALKTFQALDKDYPNNVDVKLVLASIYRGFDKTDEALTVYEEILKIDPNNPTAHAQRALLTGKSEHVEAAITSLEQSLDIDSTNVESYVNLGRIYGWKQRIDDAEKVYLKALKLDPKNVDALNALAGLYNVDRKWDKSVKLYHKALRLVPNNRDSIDGLELVYAALSPSSISRYQYFYFKGSDDILAGVPDRMLKRNDFIEDIVIPLNGNLEFQFRTQISTESGANVTGLGPMYSFSQLVLGPRVDFRILRWLSGSGRYLINFYQNTSAPADITPLISENSFNQGYGFLKGTFGPVTIIPSFSREQFTFSSLGGRFSEVVGYDDWALGSTIAVNQYWDLIPSFIYRTYDQEGRDPREIYDFLTRIRIPNIPGFELGYGFFFANNPTQRPQIFLARFFGEPTNNLLLDFQFTFSNDLAFALTPTQGYEWKLFTSYKINPRYRINFEGLGGFQKGGNDTQELSLFAFVTVMLGKVKVPKDFVPPPETVVEYISGDDIQY